MTFWTRWSKVLFPKRSVKMIEGSEKRNPRLAFKLQNSHVCEKPSKSQNRGSYAQAQSPYHLCGKPPGDSGENSNRRHRTVHPGGIFRKKVIPSEIYITFFFAFAGIPENFCSICPQLSVPDYFRWVQAIMPKMADSRLVTLPNRLWRNSCFILVSIINRLLTTQL